MIRKIIFLIFIFCLISSPCYPGTITVGGQTIGVNNITTEASVSTAIVSGKVAFCGIIIKTDGVNNITLNIYDNTIASGKPLVPTDTIILGNLRLVTLNYYPPIRCNSGIYVSVSVAGGGTCSYQVIYDNGN